jgi:hypothetical protein
MIKLKNILSEASLKGVEGVPSNKKLSQLSDNDKLKIVQSSGNLISFKVPDWSKGKRNFWTVISNGKIVQKKNLDGITIFILPGKGPEKVSPSYSSVKDLLNGVDWDTMELRRESVNEKNDDDFTDYLSSRKSYSPNVTWKVIQKDGKYSLESDYKSGRVRLMYNGKQIASGVNDWSTGGYEIEHSSWKNKEKPFQFAKDVIKYFKSNKLTTESVNEESYKVAGRPVTLIKGKKSDATDWKVKFQNGKETSLSDVLALIKPFPKGVHWRYKNLESVKEAAVKTPDFIVTSIPADAIPSTNISKADVGLGLAMFDALGRGWTLNNKDYKLDYHNGKVALKLTSSGKMAVRVKSGHEPKYVQKIEKFANDYLSKYAKEIKK